MQSWMHAIWKLTIKGESGAYGNTEAANSNTRQLFKDTKWESALPLKEFRWTDCNYPNIYGFSLLYESLRACEGADNFHFV